MASPGQSFLGGVALAQNKHARKAEQAQIAAENFKDMLEETRTASEATAQQFNDILIKIKDRCTD